MQDDGVCACCDVTQLDAAAGAEMQRSLLQRLREAHARCADNYSKPSSSSQHAVAHDERGDSDEQGDGGTTAAAHADAIVTTWQHRSSDGRGVRAPTRAAVAALLHARTRRRRDAHAAAVQLDLHRRHVVYSVPALLPPCARHVVFADAAATPLVEGRAALLQPLRSLMSWCVLQCRLRRRVDCLLAARAHATPPHAITTAAVTTTRLTDEAAAMARVQAPHYTQRLVALAPRNDSDDDDDDEDDAMSDCSSCDDSVVACAREGRIAKAPPAAAAAMATAAPDSVLCATATRNAKGDDDGGEAEDGDDVEEALRAADGGDDDDGGRVVCAVERLPHFDVDVSEAAEREVQQQLRTRLGLGDTAHHREHDDDDASTRHRRRSSSSSRGRYSVGRVDGVQHNAMDATAAGATAAAATTSTIATRTMSWHALLSALPQNYVPPRLSHTRYAASQCVVHSLDALAPYRGVHAQRPCAAPRATTSTTTTTTTTAAAPAAAISAAEVTTMVCIAPTALRVERGLATVPAKLYAPRARDTLDEDDSGDSHDDDKDSDADAGDVDAKATLAVSWLPRLRSDARTQRRQPCRGSGGGNSGSAGAAGDVVNSSNNSNVTQHTALDALLARYAVTP